MQKILLAFGLFLVSTTAFSQAQNHLKNYPLDSWELQFQSTYFSSNANYLSTGGTYQSLSPENYFKLTTFDFGVRKVFTSKWALGSSLQLASGESQTAALKRTNSALTFVKLYSDFVLLEGSFDLILEPYFTYPLLRNSLDSDAMAISEGAMEFGGLARLQTSFTKLRWGIFTGFNYRDEGRSSLVPYGTVAEIKIGSVLFGGELSGYRSIGFDKSTSNDTDRVTWTNRVNGGSYKFYSINPSLLETRFWSTFMIDPKFWFKLGGGLTLNGSSSASGWELSGQIQWRFKTSDTNSRTSSETQRFKADMEDGVDQKLFSEEKPSTMDDAKRKKSGLQEELDNSERTFPKKSDKKIRGR